MGPRRATAALESLFPPCVRVAVWDGGDDVPQLFAEECRAVSNSVLSRRLEFAKGRACARMALATLGQEAVSVPVGVHRGPVWPPGFLGSITHCDGLTAAVVGRAHDLRGLGIDVEGRAALDEELIEVVCTSGEIAAIEGTRPGEVGMWSKVLFSAKESVHKAIYPRTGRWLDFLDVEVSIDFRVSSFSVAFAHDRVPVVPELAALHGRFCFFDDFVLTGIALPIV